MKHFTSIEDVNDINALVDKAMKYKHEPMADSSLGAGKRLGLLFMNPSMRTRISTQIAARNLGMDTVVLNMDKEGWQLELNDEAIMNGTSVEHIKDAAPVLGSYFDMLGVRTFPKLDNKEDDYSELLIRQLVKHTGIPVLSLESSTLHPLQSLADLITIKEHSAHKQKLKVVLTWAPHIKPIPHCVANSFAQWMNAWEGSEFVIAHPEGYELDRNYVGNAAVVYDQREALRDADFVYVKNWSSVSDYGKVLNTDSDWMLTPEHLKHTNQARVMHCLPVRREVELSSAVLDSAHSIVSKQAANRVWAAQAVISELLNNPS